MPDDPTDLMEKEDIETGVSMVDLPSDWLEEIVAFRRKRRRLQIMERERDRWLKQKEEDAGT